MKVKEVTLGDADMKYAENGFIAACSWDVKGSVGHWGHIHQRVNRYKAEVDVELIDGIWKITALNILEEQRVK